MNKRKHILIDGYFIKQNNDKKIKPSQGSDRKLHPIDCTDSDWTHITGPQLSLSTLVLYTTYKERKHVFSELESQIAYINDPNLTSIKVFGKTHNLPRKHAAYGCKGITYTYSGIKIPATPWEQAPILKKILEDVKCATDIQYNFVLINRYQNGHDKMGEHKDDEKELDPDIPIASLSFGQERDFVFRHQNLVKKSVDTSESDKTRHIKKLLLKDGMLLMMNSPTNRFWYHSLPQRSTKICPDVRINLTFRKIV